MRANDLTTVISNSPAVREIRQAGQVRADTTPRQTHLEAIQREEHKRETVNESSETESARVDARNEERSGGKHPKRKKGERSGAESGEPETPIADGDRGRLIDLKA